MAKNIQVLYSANKCPFIMAHHYIATTTNSSKYAFRLFAGKKAKYVSCIGETSLDTSTHPYSRMYEASYYLNIIANNSYGEWSNVVDKLKAYAKELNPSMMHYEAYQREHEREYREIQEQQQQ